ncbi:MAG: hypothetical protein FJ090_18625 [Deltaproteobacteria bacterium]|nr:hypothetical protein [Deltaproteobacteria bacterium]
MSTQKKGFDPLASLFDRPEPDEERRVELKVPPALPPAQGEDVPVPAHLQTTAAFPPAPDVPAALATHAAAPAASAPVGPDPAELAKILARAAVARASAQKPAVPAGKGALAAAPPPKAAPAAEMPTLSSRIGAAPPPRKAISADEALAAARAEEGARAKVAAAPRPAAASAAAPAPRRAALTADQLTDVVSAQIAAVVPEVGAVYIANAVVVDDRAVLTALWKAHRARFANQADIAAAAACSTVLRALGSVAPGQLAVAHVVTDKSDWLVWIDLDCGPLAAFNDARALFARV